MGWNYNGDRSDTLSIAAEQGRRERLRKIVKGDPCAAEKVARATEVLDRIESAGRHNYIRLQANKGARETERRELA